jgi:hypothetical protein
VTRHPMSHKVSSTLSGQNEDRPRRRGGLPAVMLARTRHNDHSFDRGHGALRLVGAPDEVELRCAVLLWLV